VVVVHFNVYFLEIVHLQTLNILLQLQIQIIHLHMKYEVLFQDLNYPTIEGDCSCILNSGFVFEMGHTWPEGLEVSATTQSQIFHCQMAEFNVHLKQRSVNEFLPAEGDSQLVLTNVCSQCAVKQLWT